MGREVKVSVRSGTYVEERKCGEVSFYSFDHIGALVSRRRLMLGSVCINRNPTMIENQRLW